MAENFGKKRIQFFMDLLSNNLDAALQAYKDNPAQPFGFYVHLHDCRTPLFKIQALARILGLFLRFFPFLKQWRT